MHTIQKQSAINTVVSFVGMVLGFVNIVFLFPKFFSTAEVGLVRILIQVATIYAQLSALGFNNILLKFFPYYKNKANKHNGLLPWALIFSFLGFLLTTILFYFFKPFLIEIYIDKSPLLIDFFFYIIPLALFVLFHNILEAYLRALKKTVFPSIIRDIILRLGISISIFIFMLDLVDFKTFIIIYLFVYGAVVVLIVFYSLFLRQLFLKPKSIFFKIESTAAILNYGLYSLLGSISSNLTNIIDSLMLAALLGLSEVGIYTTAFFITSVIMIPARSIFKIATPFISEYWRQEQYDKINKLYKKVTLNNMLFGSIIFIGIWINLDNIFGFMPPEYANGKWIVLFIGFGRMVDLTTGINGIILSVSDKYRYDLYFNIALALLTIITNFIFIPLYNINGAAFATLIAMSSIHIFRVIFLWYNYKIQPFQKSNLTILVVGIFTFLVISMMPYLGNVFLDIIIRSILASIIYFVPLILLKTSEDLNAYAKSFIGKIRRAQ